MKQKNIASTHKRLYHSKNSIHFVFYNTVLLYNVTNIIGMIYNKNFIIFFPSGFSCSIYSEDRDNFRHPMIFIKYITINDKNSY